MPKTRGVRGAALAMIVAAAWLAVGCGPETADYSSIWTTPTSPTETSAEEDPEARPVPIAEYLASMGITGEQIPLDKLTDLKVTLPRPAGWTKYVNPNFSRAPRRSPRTTATRRRW